MAWYLRGNGVAKYVQVKSEAMKIKLHPHAKQRAIERGATEEEIKLTVLEGEKFPAKFERFGFRRNFIFEDYWQAKYYRMKQIEAYAVWENNNWVVITIIVKYF